MTVGERIKEVREKAGISQVDFADKINVSKQTLYKYENNLITNIPSDKIEAVAKVGGVSPAYLMGWEDYEDPRIAERDAIFDDIERILKIKGWSLSCESYDDDYFTIKNINGQTITGLYDYELISRYQSLKKRGKITADLLVSSESVFKKYLESLGYYIDRDDLEHKPFIHYGNGAVKISDSTLNDIRTRIDTYAKATIDSIILKLNEKELRKEREEKERFAAYLLNAAQARTDIDVPEGVDTSENDVMDDKDF